MEKLRLTSYGIYLKYNSFKIIKQTQFNNYHQIQIIRKLASTIKDTNDTQNTSDSLKNKSLNIQLRGAYVVEDIKVYQDIYKYIINHSRIPDVLLKLREETSKFTNSSNLQMTIDQGPFISMLLKFMRAKNAIEIGTYTGYSAIVLAQSLPKDGKLITIDINDEMMSIAEKYWKEAGVRDKIQYMHGDSIEMLNRILNDGKENFFDVVFIDGAKRQYEDNYELALKLIKKGGAILIDNVLWRGEVVKEMGKIDKRGKNMKILNEKLHNDDRIEYYILNMGDGLGLCRKL